MVDVLPLVAGLAGWFLLVPMILLNSQHLQAQFISILMVQLTV